MSDTLVVGMDEAQDRLPELIDMVQSGTTVAISRGGTVAANLTSSKEAPRKGNGPELARIAEEGLASRPGPGPSAEEIDEYIRIERESWDRSI